MACAAVLFANGIRIESAIDAAKALQPLAGQYASLLFAAGFFGAALFGAFIIPISTSFYVCEAFGWESGVNKKFKNAKNFYVLLLLMIFISATAVLIPNINLFNVIVFAQFINGIILPVILVIILKIANNKKLMGDYSNTRWVNIASWIGCGFVILASVALLGASFING